MLLVLDNRDSFTFNLVQAFQALGEEVRVLRSRETSAASVRELAPDRVVVGPGPGTPRGAGASIEVVLELGRDVPLLGVCLGHQAIAEAFGARIGRAAELVHGRAVTVHHDGQGVFRRVPDPSRFTRYNSLAVLEETLPDCLEVTARAENGELMGLRHREWPLEGVQFHPESVLSEGGGTLLANFLARDATGRGRAR